ncbi:hypothetical protein CVT26_008791 [Gymnopilus dilepis]|uniref:Uncharacterized protein n=1 Tax=Gymnopilus dilepis TaxID=231916 RepID=A0A409W9J5_9AGAR|nr:hypothetical protein CVT26_008791 [Gymnopilus dilepis]
MHPTSLREISADGDDMVQVHDVVSIITEGIKDIDIDASSIEQAVNRNWAISTASARQLKDDTAGPSLRNGPGPDAVGLAGSCTLKAQITKLNLDLEDVQISLADLIRHRKRMHVDLLSRTETPERRRREAESPQGKLPIELWAQIFFLCLPDEEFVQPNPRQAPLLLCQICKPWRRVATGTPLLWSKFSIRGSWRRNIWKSSLECWLKRSENAYLSLDISIPAYMEPAFDAGIVQLITSTAERWYHLRLNMPDNLLRAMLSESQMPVLHKLEFSSTYPIAPLEIQGTQAPQLKTVSLLTKSLYPQPLTLPWSQLTILSLQCWLNIGQHLEVLRKCPRLESYCMCLVPAEVPLDSRPLVMYHLRRLEIVAFIDSAMGPVLTRFQLPKLTQLSFVVPTTSPACGIAGWPKHHVVSLVERSSCLLKKIRLKGVEVVEEAIEETKNSIPSLIEVTFS